MFGFFNSRTSLNESGLLKGFVDNHSHVLYGVDDGVKTIEESLEILNFLEAAGTTVLWCTPHIMEDVPNETADLRSRFESLKEAWKGKIELRLASENMLDSLFMKRLEKDDFLLHGDNRLLVETSTWASPMDLWGMIGKINAAGYTPLIAHPERYTYMKMDDYKRLLDMGAEFQLNMPSILGVYGDRIAKRAEEMLKNGWYVMTGSDCHRFRALEGQTSCKIFTKNTVALLKGIVTR